ncbi:MAG TPA: choline monooxygenase [Bacteroidetes bacterium]|nr:choline monooxygenase [Bacteroidota bacterium]
MPLKEDIRSSSTLPGSFYRNEALYRQSLDVVFANSWQLIGHRSQWTEGYQIPFVLLPGSLNEPLILHTGAEPFVSSNVCTHRGFILVEKERPSAPIRCRYHGRLFDANGCFRSMPEFEDAADFPRREDDLARPSFVNWKGFFLCRISEGSSAHTIIDVLDERLGFFPFHDLQYSAERSREFHVKAHWALYCDNYLEGFHIPYVHQALNKVIDYGQYETHLFDSGTLQIGIGKEGEPCFDLPAGHPDQGKQVAAYYYWFFPNWMVNVYPWGISVNIVEPIDIGQTRVRFLTYVARPEMLDQGAGSGLHAVEMEDEEVVESVHRGLTSRLYRDGRFSPAMETGVHHFHLLLQHHMADFLLNN